MRLWWWLVFCVCVGGCGSSAKGVEGSIENQSILTSRSGEATDIGFEADSIIVVIKDGVSILRFDQYGAEDPFLDPASVIRPSYRLLNSQIIQGEERVFAVNEENMSWEAATYLIRDSVDMVDWNADYSDVQFSYDGNLLITASYNTFKVFDITERKEVNSRTVEIPESDLWVRSQLVPGSFGTLLVFSLEDSVIFWNPILDTRVNFEVSNDEVNHLYVYKGRLWSDYKWPPRDLGAAGDSGDNQTSRQLFESAGPWRYRRLADKKSAEYKNHDSGEVIKKEGEKILPQFNCVLPFGVEVNFLEDVVELKPLKQEGWIQVFTWVDGRPEEFCIVTSNSEYAGTDMCPAFLNAGEKGLKNNISGVREFYLKMMKFK